MTDKIEIVGALISPGSIICVNYRIILILFIRIVLPTHLLTTFPQQHMLKKECLFLLNNELGKKMRYLEIRCVLSF